MKASKTSERDTAIVTNLGVVAPKTEKNFIRLQTRDVENGAAYIFVSSATPIT